MSVVRKLVVPLAVAGGVGVLLLIGGVLFNGTVSAMTGRSQGHVGRVDARTMALVAKGRKVFRYDTFGDQAVWGGVLGLQKAIEGAKLGGVGPV